MTVFEGKKSSNDILNIGTMSADEVVASDVPPRYLFLSQLFSGRHYRSTPDGASENQEKNNDQDTTKDPKTTGKPNTPTLLVNITVPVTDLPTTPSPPVTVPVNITTPDTDQPATGSHDDDVGRDKRYFFIYPTWSRRAYWRTRLMSSRWWSPWWASWDGWYDIGVWDAYNWAGLDWWGDFYYSIGKQFACNASFLGGRWFSLSYLVCLCICVSTRVLSGCFFKFIDLLQMAFFQRLVLSRQVDIINSALDGIALTLFFFFS